MYSAFEDSRDALMFSALLLFFLLLPVILLALGTSPRLAIYDGISERAGPYIFTRQQLTSENDVIDVAIVGSSILKEAIDVDYIQRELDFRLGRKTNVRSFPFVFQGFDLQYALIRDLLESRRIKILITSFSGPHRLSNRPHEQLHRFLRFGDYADALRGLPLADRAAIYASQVLGAPRHAVSMIRADRPANSLTSRRSQSQHQVGTVSIPNPATPIFVSESTLSQFELAQGALTTREAHFVKLIGALASKFGAKLLVVSIPVPEDAERDVIWERADYRSLLPPDAVVVGFRPSALFGPHFSQRQFYMDDVHFNQEGQTRYTLAIEPPLVDLLSLMGPND